ncbi:CLIP domain-containing serine protease C9-like [Anopheles moucheti]|uniref:CLIP domain-containing serine protease C9-like n=1 Tax=Anopheles moucheti TaxID=186751 RepID=UPI0022F09B2E|nr:CLIP domain-containing serine protease C9-like [Anopheles moucheti]
MVQVSVLVVMQILLICNTFGGSNCTETKFLEGRACHTHSLDNGKCMKKQLCDPAFIHSLPNEDHPPVCQQNAFYEVLCCKPFLDFCKHRIKTQIAHGTEAGPGMFPHLARLGEKNDVGEIEWRCSANIISVKFLLTAAHCKLWTAIAGVDCTGAVACEQQMTVENFISHPKYSTRTKHHDIAVVKLDKNIEFNRNVLPICPYVNKNDIPGTEDMTIAGWGRNEDYILTKRLMYATVRTVSINKCNDDFKELVNLGIVSATIIAEQYCAQGSLVKPANEYRDACEGDSGGPLQVKQSNAVYLVGVISAGIGCAGTRPGVYARVAAYFDWINSTITASP